ncbi:MAG: DUF362 domain-containing protein [Bacillota bacterium]|nr:DUF362 domain-containing protein [Bacillota bacterium]
MPKEINREKSTVALVRCESYDREAVKDAVGKAIQMIGGLDEILAGISAESLLLLKPNLLAKAPAERACTTHPEVFRAAAELLQEAGRANLKYGDSPGNPLYGTEKTAEVCGIKAAADELGIPAGDFESGVDVEYAAGRYAKKFTLCSEVAELIAQQDHAKAGGIINICKMKTHQLERVTGAVKNTFGCVYGINKAAFHAQFPTAEAFAKMIADLNGLVRPKLHIMDGIVAMEGNGPGSGDPKEMHVILASTDPVALDALFCHLIYLDPKLVATQTAAMEAGVGRGADDDVAVIACGLPMIPDGTVMTMEEAALKCGDRNFDVQRGRDYCGSARMLGPLAKILEKKPYVLLDRCVGCGICVDSCPLDPKAIRLGPDRKPVYDHRSCIKCYCCQEMCPEKAINVKKSFLARLADRSWRI